MGTVNKTARASWHALSLRRRGGPGLNTPIADSGRATQFVLQD